jgi:F-type H+-transporting ATPase subunit a
MDSFGGFAGSLLAAAGSGDHEADPYGLGFNVFYFSALLFIIAGILIWLARRGLTTQGPFSNVFARMGEHLILFIQRLVTNLMGPSGQEYVPILTAFWLYVFLSNMMALFLPTSPSADLSLNLGAAIITVLYVQYEGIKANGFLGYLRHFAGPTLGKPQIGKTLVSILKFIGLTLALFAVAALIFMVEIASEILKNFSLSIRLYGNIEGGHIVKESLDSLVKIPSPSGASWPVPFSAVIFVLKFFTSIIQAYIWVMLFGVYLKLITSHDDHQEDHHGLDPVAHSELPAGVPAH